MNLQVGKQENPIEVYVSKKAQFETFLDKSHLFMVHNFKHFRIQIIFFTWRNQISLQNKNHKHFNLSSKRASWDISAHSFNCTENYFHMWSSIGRVTEYKCWSDVIPCQSRIFYCCLCSSSYLCLIWSKSKAVLLPLLILTICLKLYR